MPTPTPELIARLLASPLEFRQALARQEGPGCPCWPVKHGGYLWLLYRKALLMPDGAAMAWFPSDSAAWMRAACEVLGEGWWWEAESGSTRDDGTTAPDEWTLQRDQTRYVGACPVDCSLRAVEGTK